MAIVLTEVTSWMRSPTLHAPMPLMTTVWLGAMTTPIPSGTSTFTTGQALMLTPDIVMAAAVLAWRQLSPFRRVAVPLVAGGVGLAGYQAWRAVRHGESEPTAAEVLGQDLTEAGGPSVGPDPDATPPLGVAGRTPPPGAGASRGEATDGDGQGSGDGTRGATMELDENRLLSLEEAAEQIGSPPAQVRAMVEEGLLEPEAGTDPPQFRFAVVQAARLAGG